MNRTSLHIFVVFLVAISLFSAGQARGQVGWKWGASSVPADNRSFEVLAAAVDDSGNVLTAGFTGLAVGGSSTALHYLVFGADTVFNLGLCQSQVVVKTDSNGHFLWARGSQHADTWPLSIKADKDGSVYVFGIYTDSSYCSFDADTLLNPLLYANYYLVKYSAAGSVLWARNVALSASTSATDAGDMGIDSAGNIYMTGAFNFSSISIGSSTLVNTSATGDTPDVFVTRYDRLGNPMWAKSFGGHGYDFPNTMSVAPSGHLYITGAYTSATMTIGASTLTDTVTFAGHLREVTFFTKFDSGGHTVWAEELNNKLVIRGTTMDDSENVYMTGDLDSAAIIGPDTLASLGSGDLFVGKFDSAGNVVWANSAGDIYTDNGWSIALDHCNNVWVAGAAYRVASSINFNGHVVTLPTDCYDPAFLAEYTIAGQFDTAIVLRSGGEDYLFVGTDQRGGLYVSGDFADVPMVFGPDTLTPYAVEPVFMAPTEEELFIGKYQTSCVPVVDSTPSHAGVVSIGAQNDLSLYPNPAAHSLIIRAQGSIDLITITNLVGQIVYNSYFNSKEVEVDVAGFPAGVYVVRVNGSVVRKFVKE